MKYKNKTINNQENEIEKQLNHTLAYGIDGVGITPAPEETIGNEDIEADKNSSREWNFFFIDIKNYKWNFLSYNLDK